MRYRGRILSLRRFSGLAKFNVAGSMDFQKTLTIQVGQYAEVKHIFDQSDVNTFAGLCGDNNPIHIDPELAKKSMFGGTIVHGIFTSSLFSTIFGRALPGAIYVDQHLSFKRPVHMGREVMARVEVLEVKESRKGSIIVCSTTCKLSDDTLAIDGKASVLLPFKKAA